MAIEKVRGCGYRKVGGIYLVGSGLSRPCDILPIEIVPCPTCGFSIPFTRGFMWLHKGYIEHKAEEHHLAKVVSSPVNDEGMTATVTVSTSKRCSCPPNCPLCYPTSNSLEQYGLMFVGNRYYTPEEFVAEAQKQGVSKRIGKIPKGLIPGKTWVLLAHNKVPFQNEVGGLMTEPEYKPAIFYAFVPKRVEQLIWKSEATPEKLEELKKQGITAVVVPDGDKDHTP